MFRPGYLNADSLQRLQQVRTGQFTDWYDPVLLWVWRVVLRSITPSVILFLQVAGLLVGLFAVLRVRLPPLSSATAAIAVVVSPPVLAQAMLVGRDTWLAVFAVTACGAFVQATRTTGWGARACWGGGAVAMVGALAARQNAAPIVVALAVPLLNHAAQKRVATLGRTARLAIVGGASCLVVIGSLAALRAGEGLVGTTRTNPGAGNYAYDLAAMSLRVDDVLLDATTFPAQDLEVLRQGFDPAAGIELFSGTQPLVNVNVGRIDADHSASLERDWRRAVRHHPIAYLQARGDYWLRLVGLRGDTPKYVVHLGVDSNAEGYELHNQVADDVARRYLGLFADAPTFVRGGLLFKPWLYLLVAVGTAVWLLRREGALASRLVAGLALGAVVYECTYMIVGGSAYYRYSYPLVVCTSVAGVVAVATAMRRRGAPAAARRRRSSPSSVVAIGAVGVTVAIVAWGVAANASTVGRPAVAPTVYLVARGDGDASAFGSLPWAVRAANAHRGPDYIQFDPSVADVAVDAPLVIDDRLVIDGARSADGTDRTRISGLDTVDRLVVLEAGSSGSSLGHLDLAGFTAVGIDVTAAASGGFLVGNQIASSRRGAIAIQIASDRTAVIDNVVSGPGIGVMISSPSQATGAAGNGLTSNRITMCGPDTIAVLVDGGANNWIGPGNEIAGTHAVVVIGSTANGNAVTGNVIGAVDGVTCAPNVEVGVIVAGGATGNGVYDNEFTAPLSVPIAVDDASSAELKGNRSSTGAPVTATSLPSTD